MNNYTRLIALYLLGLILLLLSGYAYSIGRFPHLGGGASGGLGYFYHGANDELSMPFMIGVFIFLLSVSLIAYINTLLSGRKNKPQLVAKLFQYKLSADSKTTMTETQAKLDYIKPIVIANFDLLKKLPMTMKSYDGFIKQATEVYRRVESAWSYGNFELVSNSICNINFKESLRNWKDFIKSSGLIHYIRDCDITECFLAKILDNHVTSFIVSISGDRVDEFVPELDYRLFKYFKKNILPTKKRNFHHVVTFNLIDNVLKIDAVKTDLHRADYIDMIYADYLRQDSF
jgi:hypothetical protein